MVTIKCSVYEKGNLYRILEYAKEKKLEDFRKGKITEKLLNYDTEIINTLIKRFDGKYREDYLDEMAKFGREKYARAKYFVGEDI